MITVVSTRWCIVQFGRAERNDVILHSDYREHQRGIKVCYTMAHEQVLAITATLAIV